MKVLPRTQFGNPLLRRQTRQLTNAEIVSPVIQQLIKDMRRTLMVKKLGIGLAAPQVGKSIALAVIAVRPTPHRPKVKKFDLILINPKITSLEGDKKELTCSR
jgi:peptide deformylase